MALLRIVQNDRAVPVNDLGVQSGFAEHAVIREGREGLRHFTDGNAVGLLTQRQRRQRDVGEFLAADGFLLHEGGNAHLFRQELVALFHAEIIQRLSGDGVQGLRQAAHDIAQAAVGSRIVERPVAVVIHGGILIDRRRRDDALLQRRRVNRKRLEGGARGQQAHGRTVVHQAAFLLAHAAGHRDDVACGVVDQDDRGLKLLRADRLGHVVQIFIDTVHNALRFGIVVAVDLVAAGHQLHGSGLLAAIVFLAKIRQHIIVYRIGIPRIVAAAADGMVRRFTVRAVIRSVLALGILRFCAFKAALIADVGFLVISAVAEHQFLLRRRLVFFPRLDIALIVHLLENGELTLTVVLLTDIGVIQGGIVGNADQ